MCKEALTNAFMYISIVGAKVKEGQTKAGMVSTYVERH
jgi:hypothetical protein